LESVTFSFLFSEESDGVAQAINPSVQKPAAQAVELVRKKPNWALT